MSDYKVSIEIFNTLVNHICKYATLLVENLEYSVHKIKFTDDMDEAEVELRIPYGKTEINFLGSPSAIPSQFLSSRTERCIPVNFPTLAGMTVCNT